MWRTGIFALLLAVGCGSGLRRYPLKDPVWRDDDQHPFSEKPEEYYSPLVWDGVDHTMFRPISRFFAIDPAGESANVNAFDEVPDSSWFQNRIGINPMSPEEMAIGPCTEAPLDENGPWKVKSSKPNGANPGFVIKGSDGKKYLLKFDGYTQSPRATSADVIVSRIYYAAGYFVPCNRIVFFNRSILSIADDATAETPEGDEIPMTEHHLDKIFAKATRVLDGRYRGASSLYLKGKPLGPWKYQETRGDDPNDVVDHQDRRELRGARVLAAWVDHIDQREQNTLGMWIETGSGLGYVRHNILDFGDCLGTVWEPPAIGRSRGKAYLFDVGYVGEDFLTLGIIRRPWDKARFGPTGPVFGYFDINLFDPGAWRPDYPNPAFIRMSERDGAWMARIIAHFTDEHLRRVIRTAMMGNKFYEDELFRVLRGRREKVLRRWLTKVSPLAHPSVEKTGGRAELCLSDLAVYSGIADRMARRYRATAYVGNELRAFSEPVQKLEAERLCVALPSVSSASPSSPEYMILDVIAGPGRGEVGAPLRAHLYQLGATDYRVVAIERPYHDDPPG